MFVAPSLMVRDQSRERHMIDVINIPLTCDKADDAQTTAQKQGRNKTQRIGRSS